MEIETPPSDCRKCNKPPAWIKTEVSSNRFDWKLLCEGCGTYSANYQGTLLDENEGKQRATKSWEEENRIVPKLIEIRCPTCDNAFDLSYKCDTCKGAGVVKAVIRPLTQIEIQQSHAEKGLAYEAYCERMNSHFQEQNNRIEEQAKAEYHYNSGEDDGS